MHTVTHSWKPHRLFILRLALVMQVR